MALLAFSRHRERLDRVTGLRLLHGELSLLELLGLGQVELTGVAHLAIELATWRVRRTSRLAGTGTAALRPVSRRL